MKKHRKNPAAAALGRMGGRARTLAKALAAVANGAKGGRPRKAAAKAREPRGKGAT